MMLLSGVVLLVLLVVLLSLCSSCAVVRDRVSLVLSVDDTVLV